MKTQSLIITNEQVKQMICLEEVIDCVEKTWRWHGEGEVNMPPKITTDFSPYGKSGWFNSMPAYIHPLDTAGIKVVGGFLENTKIGLPFIKSHILLLDPDHGFLKALLCGDWISDARTGAQPAIAMKLLAASTQVVTIIGAGRQAHFAAACILAKHTVRELRICDLKKEARDRFLSDFSGAPCEIVSYEDNENACRGADVIITLTTANAPLVHEAWCKPGCLVLTMGSFTETAADVVQKFDERYLDCLSQGLHRGNFKEFAEKGIISENNITAELPDILTGRKKGRRKKEDRILCELVGMGSPDICIAAEVYKRIINSSTEVLYADLLGEPSI